MPLTDEQLSIQRIEVAKAFLLKARDEAIQRLAHRERGLFFFASALAIFASLIVANPEWYLALLIVPPASCGVAFVLLQYDEVIGVLARYQKYELAPILDAELNGKSPRVWELSTYLDARNRQIILRRMFGHIVILVIPAFFSLVALAIVFFSPSTIVSVQYGVRDHQEAVALYADRNELPASLRLDYNTIRDRHRSLSDWTATDWSIVIAWMLGACASMWTCYHVVLTASYRLKSHGRQQLGSAKQNHA